MFSLWLTVTTTTSFLAARRLPLVRGVLALPYAKAPPWNHTITGRFAAGSHPGVQMFTVRQFSVSGDGSAAPEKFSSSGRVGGRRPACGALPENSEQSRTPDQAAAGWGGKNR